MKMLRSSISLDASDTVSVELTDEETGESISKKILLPAYLRMLERVSCDEARTIPRLPEGTLGGLRYLSDSSFYIEVYVEADVHPTAYMREDNIAMLPFPSLIFMISVKEGKMESSRCYAVRDRYRAVNDDTELYRFPYGNVYEDGRICWGGNYNVVNVPCVTKVEDVIALFFSAVMNNDLYSFNTKRKVPLEQLIDENSKKDRFPESTLLLMGTLGTLRKV